MNSRQQHFAFGAFNSIQGSDDSTLTFRVIVPCREAPDDAENEEACGRLKKDRHALANLAFNKLKLRRPLELSIYLGEQSADVALGKPDSRDYLDKVALGALSGKEVQKLRCKPIYSICQGLLHRTEPLQIPGGRIQQCIISAELQSGDTFSMLSVEHHTEEKDPKDPKKSRRKLIGQLDFLFLPKYDPCDG